MWHQGQTTSDQISTFTPGPNADGTLDSSRAGGL
jgi:hypothetical protein